MSTFLLRHANAIVPKRDAEITLKLQCRLYTENTHHRGKYHCTADFQFDWFGFDQKRKTVANSTYAKLLNPNKINRRSAIQ